MPISTLLRDPEPDLRQGDHITLLPSGATVILPGDWENLNVDDLAAIGIVPNMSLGNTVSFLFRLLLVTAATEHTTSILARSPSMMLDCSDGRRY